MTAIARRYDSAQGETTYDRQAYWLDLAPLLDNCSQHLRCLLRQCAEAHNLSERHVLLLRHCAAQTGGASQSELAGRLAVSPAQLSQLIDQLRARGMLLSTRDPVDRRRQRSSLTSAGLRLWQTVQSELRQRLERLSQALATDEREQLHSLLARLDSVAAHAVEQQSAIAADNQPKGGGEL